MEYLAKAFHSGVTYEAHVTVADLRLGLEPRFSTSLCYVNDVVGILGEQCSEVVQMMLLDDACDQHIMENY